MFEINEKVIAKTRMTQNSTDDGMGICLCAEAGDELIIRKIHNSNLFSVSHENITDRSFRVEEHEISSLTAKGRV